MKNFTGLLLVVFLTFTLLTSNLFAAGSAPVTNVAKIFLEVPARSVMTLSVVEAWPGSCVITYFDYKFFGIPVREPIFGKDSMGFSVTNRSFSSFIAVGMRGVGLLNVQINGKFWRAFLVINGEIYPLPWLPW